MKSPMLKNSWLVALALLVPGMARADNVQKELAALAQEVAQVLAKQGQTSICLGRFVGAGNVPSHYGPEITRILIAEFARMRITVDARAPIELTGQYRPADEDPAVPNSKELFIRLVAQVIEKKSGLPLSNVTLTARAVYGNAEVARVFGVPVSLPPDAQRGQRNERIKENLDNPKMDVGRQSVIRSKADSPFSVEILVVNKADAPDPTAGRPAKLENGLAFVPIARGEFYRVRFTNHAPFDVAVRLTIDGLDQFAFSDADFVIKETGKPKYSYRIVSKGETVVIAGWFRNLKEFDYFIVTEYAKSAVAELKVQPDEIGVIVAQVHAAWEKDTDRPKDEGGDRSAGDATGRQSGSSHDLKEVQRHIGVLRDTIPVRYTR